MSEDEDENAPSKFMKDVIRLFGGDDLYRDVLRVARDSSSAQLKKAYLKRSLEVHPDKNKESGSSEKFVLLSAVHDLLQDEKRRALYDETGRVEDGEENAPADEEMFARWDEYWRVMFPRVTEERIEEFKQVFVGGPQEEESVLEAYTLCEGRMDEVIDQVPFAEHEDIPFFVHDYILPALKKKKVRRYDDFEPYASLPRPKHARNKSSDAKTKKTSPLPLTAGTRQFSGAVSALEKKYGGGGKKRGAKEEALPSEDEFKKIQERMEKQRKKR